MILKNQPLNSHGDPHGRAARTRQSRTWRSTGQAPSSASKASGDTEELLAAPCCVRVGLIMVAYGGLVWMIEKTTT